MFRSTTCLEHLQSMILTKHDGITTQKHFANKAILINGLCLLSITRPWCFSPHLGKIKSVSQLTARVPLWHSQEPCYSADRMPWHEQATCGCCDNWWAPAYCSSPTASRRKADHSWTPPVPLYGSLLVSFPIGTYTTMIWWSHQWGTPWWVLMWNLNN